MYIHIYIVPQQPCLSMRIIRPFFMAFQGVGFELAARGIQKIVKLAIDINKAAGRQQVYNMAAVYLSLGSAFILASVFNPVKSYFCSTRRTRYTGHLV